MASRIFIFITGVLSAISIHGWNMRLASKTVIQMTTRARAEYHRHACGRAIAAIQNFKIIASNLQKSQQNPTKAISETLVRIQNALIDNYGNFYEIEGSFCIDRRTRHPIVIAYRRGLDHRADSPNFSYRFL